MPVAFENSIGMRFVLIPGGTFLMGTRETGSWIRDEAPQHEVTLSKPYYLSIYETTNRQYRGFDRKHDSGDAKLIGDVDLTGDAQPVVRVSQEDATAFVGWLNRKDPRHAYRLPTEAEWERACRAGSTTAYSFGGEITENQANFGVHGTRAVGSFPANAWGLHDMHGNAGEWSAEWFGTYSSTRAIDPTGPTSGTYRTLRGDGWYAHPETGRSASRTSLPPMSRSAFNGFRVAASIEPQ